jgi:hypothetical protein
MPSRRVQERVHRALSVCGVPVTTPLVESDGESVLAAEVADVDETGGRVIEEAAGDGRGAGLVGHHTRRLASQIHVERVAERALIGFRSVNVRERRRPAPRPRTERRGRRAEPLRAVALLELLARPAPAGVVAADLVLVGDDVVR